jgi:hypothetical protein
VDIWNNVITGGTGTTPAAIGVPGSATHVYTGIFDIRNNIFGDDFSYICTLPDAWANTIVAFDYNRCPTDPIMHERDTSTDYTLAQLQALSQALNCFTTDPGCVDFTNHNYQLTSSSPCVDTGINVGLDEDHIGNSVPIGGIVDIGAYEYPEEDEDSLILPAIKKAIKKAIKNAIIK